MNDILIVHNNREFIRSLEKDPLSKRFPPLFVASCKEAQDLLAKNDTFAAVFVSASLSVESQSSLKLALQELKNSHPTIPIFLIGVGDQSLSGMVDDLEITGIIPQGTNYSEMLHLSGVSQVLNNEGLPHKSTSSDGGTKLLAQDKEFFSVRASEFVSGATALFDLFIKIRPGVYLKVLKAGDAFHSERLNNYLKKGVTHFYLQRQIREEYVAYCATLSTHAVQNRELDLHTKVSQTMVFGEETLKLLQDQGLREEETQFARTFINHVQQVIMELPISNNEVMQKFMSHLVSYDHGVSVTMIASLIARQMQMSSDWSIQIVGVASLLHDIGLINMPESFQDEDESSMTPEELNLFNTHPEVGSQILARIKGIHPSVVQAAGQHHFGKVRGMRSQVGKFSSPVSQIVGISNEFVVAIKKCLKNPSNPNLQDPKKTILSYFGSLSVPVVEAFSKAFMK